MASFLAGIGTALCTGVGCGGPVKELSSREASTEVRYDKLVRAAWAQIGAGRAERGERAARRATALQGDRPEAYAALGHALAMQEKLEPAAQSYEQARAYGTDERRVFLELSSVYDVLGAYDKAVEIYRAWLERHESDAEMQQQLGLTLLLLKQPAQAIVPLEKAARLAPGNLQVREDLGYAQLLARDLEAASKTLQAVIQAAPDRPAALRFLAQALATQGELVKAVTLLDRAVGLGKGQIAALRLRARLLLLVGEANRALADYERLLQLEAKDPGALLGGAGALIALGDLDRAEQLLGQAKEVLGEHSRIAFREAQIAWRRGRKKALGVIEAQAMQRPEDLEAWQELLQAGKRFNDRKRIKRAQKRLKALAP